MKKLIVLVSALLLVGFIAGASDVTLTGEVEMRWLHDFNLGGLKAGDPLTTVGSFLTGPQAELILKAVVDDNASVYLEIEEAAGSVGVFDKANFTLNLGGIFDLPVGVKVITGWDEYDMFDAVKVTMGEYEDVIGTDIIAWGHQVDIMVNDMVSLRALWANDFGVKGFAAGIAVTYDPIYVEVSLVQDDSTPEDFGKGDIEAGLEFAMEAAEGINVGAAVTMDYDIEDAVSGDSDWMLGAAVALNYMDMAKLGVAFKGMTDSEVNSMQIDIEAMPTDMIGLSLVAGLGLDDAVYAEMFDSFEGAVKMMVGPSTWYLGVLWIADGGVGIAREKSDFTTPATDSMSVFMRGELKY
jgi:hypothetical protein